jgi:toxin-antitoxin system PIN domain toxin
VNEVLLDGNVLVALAVGDHVHHHTAEAWFRSDDRAFATTPITQGTLLRLLLREGLPSGDALAVLQGFTQHEQHRFWPDNRPFDRRTLRGVVGHRQVTDAYLVALARHRRGRVATLDRGLALLHPDVAELLGQ